MLGSVLPKLGNKSKIPFPTRFFKTLYHNLVVVMGPPILYIPPLLMWSFNGTFVAGSNLAHGKV